MANIKISELEELTTVDNDDLLAIVDNSASETKKIKCSNIINDTGWVDMSNYVNTSNFAIRPGYTPMVRKIGKICYWRGSVYCNNSLSSTQADLLINIPSQYIPPIESSNSGVHYQLNNSYKIWVESGKIRVNELNNISATYDYQGYTLTDLGSYIVD